MNTGGLSRLRFDNRLVNELPGDDIETAGPRQVALAVYSRIDPEPVSDPSTMLWSREVLQQLGLSEADAQSTEFARVFSGNLLLTDMVPHATCYGGHQFGHWAGQLGDGRAINLGDVLDVDGRHQTLQLKGAGPTPYSRGADGRAVLRSSMREFLCSEAMFHLGVPTTRALSLVLTGESVVRDMFYDGRPEHEPGAIVCRVAPTFLRFGHFQMLTARGETDLLAQLLDFSIRHDYPELASSSMEQATAVRLEWFRRVCDATVDMVVHWMRVGFVHGVMNTDNMSVLGQTIDYGPYGWIDNYDPEWTPNTTDASQRRYRFGAQAEIALWNLYQLANALVPVIRDTDALKAVLHEHQHEYNDRWQQMMAGKLGFIKHKGPSDQSLYDRLDALLRSREIDMTLFFRGLGNLSQHEPLAGTLDRLLPSFYDQSLSDDEDWLAVFFGWVSDWQQRLLEDACDDTERQAEMNRVNPCYVLRNYLAQQAIDAAEQGDTEPAWRLLEVMRRPYEEVPAFSGYAARRPDWARSRPGCSMLSCSS